MSYLIRLIQAEEEHQRAIQEKTDLEMRLEEEIKSSKVSTTHAQPYIFIIFIP